MIICMENKTQKRDMTTGVIWKELIRFFLPIAAGVLIQQIYNAVDAVVVGKFVGTNALAAVGGTPATVINVIVAVFVSLTTGASVLVSQQFGAKDEEGMRRSVGTAMVFFTLLGVALSLICEPLTYQILALMQTPADITEDAALYLHIVFWGCPGLMLLNTQSGILRAVGDSRTPFLYMVIGCVTNIVLDLLFVAVFGWGVAGVAYATVIGFVVNMVLTTVKLVRSKEAYRIDVKRFRVEKKLLGQMLKIGVPAGLQGGMYGVSNAILQASINALGTIVVASWTLSGKVDGIFWALSGAASASVTTFAGQNYGAGKMDRVFHGMKVSYFLFMTMTALLIVLILGPGPLLIPLFTDDVQVIETTKKILWYLVPFYLFWTATEVASAVLRGCSNVRIPVVITGIGICLFRVIWVMTVCKVNLSLFNVSVCYPITWGVTAVAMVSYFIYWKKKGNYETV